MATASRKGFRLISVVLGSSDHFKDSQKLLDYGFANYNLKPIIFKNRFYATATVEDGIFNTVDLIAEDSVLLPLKDGERVSYYVIAPKKVKAPIFKGERIGQLQIYIDDNYAASISLVASKDIRQKQYYDIFNKLLRFWLRWELN